MWDKRLLIVALPALSWLSYAGLAIAANLYCSPVGAGLHNFTGLVMAFYATSVVTNALCTLLICTRLVLHRRETRGAGITGDADHRFLTTVTVESGAWYAIAGIVHLALYARGSPVDGVAMPVFNSLAYLTQAHVILRVALGVDFKAARRPGTPTISDRNEVWEPTGSHEKDVEVGSEDGSHRSMMPSAARL
jgi:hypothetical protein